MAANPKGGARARGEIAVKGIRTSSPGADNEGDASRAASSGDYTDHHAGTNAGGGTKGNFTGTSVGPVDGRCGTLGRGGVD